MLQCVAVCCSVLHVLQCVSMGYSVRSVLQCVAVCCSVLQYVGVCCSVLQCGAVRMREQANERTRKRTLVRNRDEQNVQALALV